jgi:hypothetical protein
MNSEVITKELERVESLLLNQQRWQTMELTGAWAKKQSEFAGVYMLFDEGRPVYVGETGKLLGRIADMLDSRHHTVRRSIGEQYYSGQTGYVKATSSQKHPDHIETLVQNHLMKLKLSVLPISFGRKEFEEYIIDKYIPVLNRKSKRGGGSPRRL